LNGRIERFGYMTTETSSPNGAMSADERQHVVRLLRRGCDEFERLTGGLDDSMWNRKTSPEQWSILEIAEHLIIVEKSVPRTILPRLMKTEAVPFDVAEERLRDSALAEWAMDGNTRVKAPPTVRPTGTYHSGGKACSELRALRDANIAYMESTEDALRAHKIPHPFFGPMDGYQWVVVMAAHHMRHNRQIERVIAG
jgi:hypothetical protein